MEKTKKELVLKKLFILCQENLSNALECEEQVLALKDPELSMWFVTTIPGADVEKHEHIIRDSKDPELYYCFVSNADRAGLEIDIEPYYQFVLNSGDVETMFWFTTYVDRDKTRELANAIMATKDPKWNYMCANYIVWTDKKAHEKVVLDTKDLEWNYQFAKEVSWADVAAHEQVILEAKDPNWSYLFMDIERANKKAHQDIILENGNALNLELLLEHCINRDNYSSKLRK